MGTVAEKIREVARDRRKKHPFIRALLAKLINPGKKIILYAPANFQNPYQTLMYSSFESSLSPVKADKILRYQKFAISNILHIHWDEFFFPVNDHLHSHANREVVETFKSNGGFIIWTVHNEFPHDQSTKDEQRLFTEYRAFMCEKSDVIHVHNEYAKEYMLTTFTVDPSKIVVIPHPSYLEWYEESPRQTANSSDKHFLLFGNMRSYKGFGLIAEAFSKVQSANKIKNINIVGNGADSIDCQAINHLPVTLKGGYIDDEDVPEMFSKADFAVFGFKSILTSGSLMLALTFGVPPIAPAHPGVISSLPESLHDLLYLPNDAADFARKIDYALSLSSEEYELKVQCALAHAKACLPSSVSSLFEQEIMQRIN